MAGGIVNLDKMLFDSRIKIDKIKEDIQLEHINYEKLIYDSYCEVERIFKKI